MAYFAYIVFILIKDLSNEYYVGGWVLSCLIC